MIFLNITEAEVRALIDMLDYWPNYDEDDMIGTTSEEDKEFAKVKAWATDLLAAVSGSGEEARLNDEIRALKEDLGRVKNEKTQLTREYNHVKKTLKGLV